MNFRKSFLVISVSFLITAAKLWAVPASPYPISIVQSDGSKLTICLHGDEFFHYKTTIDGYLLVEDDNTGFYNYAKMDIQGKIVNLNIRATDPERRTDKESRFVNTIESVSSDRITTLVDNLSRVKRKNRNISKAPIQKSYPLVGSHKSLVILVNFTDKVFVTPNPKDAFTKLLNEPGYSTNGGTGSAKDYFRDNSGGKFDPQFDVVGPYNLPGSMATYGGNISTSSASDKDTRQMVKDACALAAADGVDFSNYDVDNNGIVDNVFIYYAGYNEAESSFKNTVWPHRWYLLYDETTKYNGKVVYDYACTSELRGSSGSNMCGVGTFCHEFGHVLGLVDFYATNGATHHTLYKWDVMDYGPYLNSGRTPPAYSGHERFYLGWLTPTELKAPQNLTLDTLTSSNAAYLISQYGNHNLNGSSPNPTEYFMVENRQNKGWDKYIPGHGLLVTRVNYSISTWSSNSANNLVSSMGVDIMEADGLASDANCSGDPFPGTTNTTSYNPKLRSGIDLLKPLSEIKEVNGIITFKFMGGEFDQNLSPLATAPTDVLNDQFTANWNPQHLANSYFIDVYTKNNGVKEYVLGYQNKNVGNVLSVSIAGLNPEMTYYYVVRATDGNSITVNSNEVNVNTKPLSLNLFKPMALDATEITSSSFKAHWSWNTAQILPQSYILNVYQKYAAKDTVYSTSSFDNSTLAANWSGLNYSFYTGTGYYGTSSPSLYLTEDGSMLMTETFPYKIRTIEFWYRGKSAATTNSLNILGSTNGTDWKIIKTINPLNNSLGEKISISGSSLIECNTLKFVYSKPSDGYLALDDIKIGTQDISIIPIDKYDSLDVGNVLEYLIEGLNSNTQYCYTVSGRNTLTSTEKSNEIKTLTLMSNSISQNIVDQYSVKMNGNNLIVSSGKKSTVLKMFNLSGQQVMEAIFDDCLRIDKNQIKKGVYLLRVNNMSFKFICY